jgi:hypothetical protein
MLGAVDGCFSTDAATIEAVPNTLPYVLAERSWITASFSAVPLLGRYNVLDVHRITAWSRPSRSDGAAPGGRSSMRSDVRRPVYRRLDFATARFPPIFHTSAGGHLWSPTAAATGRRKSHDADISSVYKRLEQKSCHRAQTDLALSFYLRKHAAIESGGRSNSAYHFERINTLYSQFERVPSYTTV